MRAIATCSSIANNLYCSVACSVLWAVFPNQDFAFHNRFLPKIHYLRKIFVFLVRDKEKTSTASAMRGRLLQWSVTQS
jgi:hypothetical protein